MLDSAQCTEQETEFFLFSAKGQDELLHLLLVPVERFDKNKKPIYYYANSLSTVLQKEQKIQVKIQV